MISALLLLAADPASFAGDGEVDTALIVSVDVSGSVDTRRFALQMDGIAGALEDPGVLAAILGGPHRRIAFALAPWSDRAREGIAWTSIGSRADAAEVAARIRALQRPAGEFTCVAQMMKHVSEETLPDLPVRAGRVVMDVSGDGIDNCDGDAATAEMRDELLAKGMTINGLPVNESDPAAPVGAGAYRAPGRPFEQREPPTDGVTLESWYRRTVIGGPGAFILPARGYDDFSRAIRMKFIAEISDARGAPARVAQQRAPASPPLIE